jgi:formate dehydrogenase iron-sulfur subunit
MFGVGTSSALVPVMAAGFGLLALTASLFHLGRPHLAYRAVLGLKHSWLSREIVAFGMFAGFSTGQAFVAWDVVALPAPETLRAIFEGGTVVSGIVGVFCSVMIYVFTKREFWSFPRSLGRFFGTTAVLGASVAWTLGTIAGVLSPEAWRWTGLLVMGSTAAKLLFEASIFRHRLDSRTTALKRSAMLLSGPLSNSTLVRFACGLAGGLILPALILSGSAGATGTVAMGIASLLLLVGELAERFQYFAAVAAPRMPGKPRT